jgi:hypothetical protein
VIDHGSAFGNSGPVAVARDPVLSEQVAVAVDQELALAEAGAVVVLALQLGRRGQGEA